VEVPFTQVVTAPAGAAYANWSVNSLLVNTSGSPYTSGSGFDAAARFTNLSLKRATNYDTDIIEPVGTPIYRRVNSANVDPTTRRPLVNFGDAHTGQLSSSSLLNTQGSLLNAAGTPTFSYTATPTTISITVPAATYTLTDNVTTKAIPTRTFSFSSLVASNTYYFDLAVDLVGGVFVCSANSAANIKWSSAAVLSDCYRDGRIAVYANYPCATPATGSTGGSGGGGAGSGPQCPADYQKVLTRDRGYLRADELDIGDFVAGPVGGPAWVEVHDAVRMPTVLWSFTVAGLSGTLETFDVNDSHACKRPDGVWLRVDQMRPGDLLLGRDGDLVVVESRRLGPGHFVGLDVEGHEFSMGATCAHNVITV
jgi:hypothetical protein